MAAPPSLSNTSDKSDTINWLSYHKLINCSREDALTKCSEDFAGVPDLLPFLRDDGLNNLKTVLDEVLPREDFKLRSVGRIKQQMCEAVGRGRARGADTAKPDDEEVKGKLQKIERLADNSWTDDDELAEIVSEKMSFHHDGVDKQRGTEFVRNLYSALQGDGDEKQNVRRARQLKIVGPSNNGKTELAQWMARMWVASAEDPTKGGWIETFVTMETMDAHLWSARESTGSAPREVWGPLRYLFQQSLDNPDSRFALVLHESNRGGLFNALNRIWWEKRRNYPNNDGIPEGEELPPNLALIFTENPATADYATIGDGDDALRTRLPPESTFALVRGGTNESELAELGFSGKEGRDFSTENVGLFYAMGAEGGYSSQDWKEYLGCLAQGIIPPLIDGVDFEDSFGMAPDEFRARVAGEQIDIIRNNPPDSDSPDSEATYQLAPPGAQQPNQESKLGKRTKQIRKYLRAHPDTRLAFVHDEVANRGTNQQFYKYLRGQLQPPHFRATVDELVGKAQSMTPADKTTFGLNDDSFERRCKTTGQLISWISFTQGNLGPSVKIVHNGRELTWDEFDRVRTAGGAGGNGQTAQATGLTAPAPPTTAHTGAGTTANAAQAPTSIVGAPAGGGGDVEMTDRQKVYHFLMEKELFQNTVLVFIRDTTTKLMVQKSDSQTQYYHWLRELSRDGCVTSGDIISRTIKNQQLDFIENCKSSRGIPMNLRNPAEIVTCISGWVCSKNPDIQIKWNERNFTASDLIKQTNNPISKYLDRLPRPVADRRSTSEENWYALGDDERGGKRQKL